MPGRGPQAPKNAELACTAALAEVRAARARAPREMAARLLGSSRREIQKLHFEVAW